MKLATKINDGKKLAIKSGVRAGAIDSYARPILSTNHNEKLVRGKKLGVKSGVRAGAIDSYVRPIVSTNHNEKLVAR